MNWPRAVCLVTTTSAAALQIVAGLPGPLPKQRQRLLLHPLLLTGGQARHLLDLARVERVLSQVAVPEQPAMQRAQPLQQQGQ
jgi:hypothetical protein